MWLRLPHLDKRTNKIAQNLSIGIKGLDYKNITVLLDEKGEIIKRANVLGYPFNLLLDKDLNLIKAQPGHLNSDQIKQFVKE